LGAAAGFFDDVFAAPGRAVVFAAVRVAERLVVLFVPRVADRVPAALRFAFAMLAS
jgi:hypothetical protein